MNYSQVLKIYRTSEMQGGRRGRGRELLKGANAPHAPLNTALASIFFKRV